VSGNFGKTSNADPGWFVFSGNPHDETGDFSSRTTAGDGAAGGPDARGGVGGMRAGAASSARAEHCASKVSGKCPESFRKT
jgi:hypothetical protein